MAARPFSGTVLIVGASRGLGLAMVQEYLRRGWHVLATAREHSGERLRQLAAGAAGQLAVETLDINEPAQLQRLQQRLAHITLDVLFVNAGVTNAEHETVADVSTGEFIRVMVTNALSPLRVVETLADRVRPTGTIGVMSSGQGSVSNNTRGGHEVYRASKAALNMLMRSYAARHADDPRTLLLMAPGWVRTELGGVGARLEVGESIPGVLDVMAAHAGRGGLHYLDYQGRQVPW